MDVINFHKISLILTMFLIFCETSDFCFHEIDYYKTLYLKTFSLAISLKCDKLQVISGETEK